MTHTQVLSAHFARQFARIADKLPSAGTTDADALRTVTDAATALIPAVEYASISLGRHGQFWTVAATDGAARAADDIQYTLGSGPCIDAAVESTVYRTGNLLLDTRWPRFGIDVYEETGALSMLAFRLFIECETDLIAALNLYSDQRDAFDDADELSGTLLAARGAVALSQSIARGKHGALMRTWMSLATVRAGIRVLVDSYQLTPEQAFDVIQATSQFTHRNLADIAADIADTGALALKMPSS